MAETKHAASCRRVWRRYDLDCPRCRELARGAAPRPGWGQHKRETAERGETLGPATSQQYERDPYIRVTTGTADRAMQMVGPRALAAYSLGTAHGNPTCMAHVWAVYTDWTSLHRDHHGMQDDGRTHGCPRCPLCMGGMSMSMTARKRAGSRHRRYRGWIISRGGYVGTADDRADRWYVDREESTCWDRRGPGYATLAEARDAIRGIQRYVAGWNMPGCLPEMEPARFETFEEARDYILDELDDCLDACDDESNPDLEGEWQTERDATAIETGPFNTMPCPDGYVYWVMDSDEE